MTLKNRTTAGFLSLAVLSVVGIVAVSTVHALPSNPAHEWAFDETSGNLALDSAGGPSGVIGSSVARIVPGSNGAGGALRFSNIGTLNSSVDFGNTVGQFGASDFTVSVWFRTTDTRNQELVGNRNDGSHGNFFSIRVNNGAVVFEVDQDFGGTNYAAINSPNLYADGNWHLAVARRQGPEVDLFVDGLKYAGAPASAPANINNGFDLIAGFSPGVQLCCDTALAGDLDDIRIYNTALTDAQIVLPPDADGDGVPDSADLCPNTAPGSIVDPQGCSIAQLCPCNGPMNGGTWKNHGGFVSCTAHAANSFVDLNLISPADVGKIVSAAAQSTCGGSR